ncbi:MAG: ammonia-forming cytochrome c nitrite reductase subunit c552 [Casimicrobiaceae bacterium]
MSGKKKPGSGRKSPEEPQRAASAPPQVHTPPVAAGPSRRPGRQGLIAAAAVLAVTVVAGAAYWAQRGRLPAAVAPVVVADARYVGGAECAGCHASQQAAWHGSDHDLAMQIASEKSVLGNFAGARFAYAGTTSTFSQRDGRYFVNTDGPDGKLADYEIKYTFGVHPLQQYLIEFPGGRMQALSIAWDSRPKAQGGQRWFHLYPGQNIKAGDWLHWTSGGQNWNFTCAECHSTNLRKNFDAAADAYRTTWSERNVACEACHGPGSNHVGWARKQGDWQALAATKGLAVALDERKGVAWTPIAATGNARRSVPRASSREIDTCARCHGRAARISDDDVHGKPPLDTHRLALLDDNLYWNDGQMRDEVYNWGSFVQSRMFAAGVTCADCHDPHSLKLKAPANAVCAQCHLPAKYDGEQHTHHVPGTAGAACAACHMPTTTFMGVDPRHDHSLRIPRPDLSAKLGVPNACNSCHAKQTPQWAAAAILRWNGKVPIGYQNFAEALRAGATGAPGARGALLALIDDKAQPAIVRASAIDRLGHWMTARMLPAVSRALNDPDASVRLAAVEALAATDPPARRRFLTRMLADPVRSVRIEAARALAGPGEAGLAPDDRARFDRALGEYVAAQNYNADRPDGHGRLAALHVARGNAEGALSEYRKAIELDPTYVQAYANLADLYRARGVDGEAETVLRAGLAKAPGAAGLHHALGLVLVRQRRTADALQELAEAARLEPASARYAYVYAVALNDAGQAKLALRVLDAALARQPYDRDVLEALAHFRARAGDREAAQKYVALLRELDPESTEYAQLGKQLDGAAPR